MAGAWRLSAAAVVACALKAAGAWLSAGACCSQEQMDRLGEQGTILLAFR